MVTAKELHDKANEIGNVHIPESVIDYMVESAKNGMYSVTLSAHTDLHVVCELNSHAEVQHAKLDKIKKYLVSHGYRVDFTYPYCDASYPIDGVIVSW